MCPTHSRDWILFGRIGRPHGVRGGVWLWAFNPSSTVLQTQPLPLKVRLELGASHRELSIVECSGHQGRFGVRFAEVSNRTEAAGWVNHAVLLPRSLWPDAKDAQFFIQDLVGCTVISREGATLGEVASTYWNGGQDIMCVTHEGAEDRFIPVVAEFVLRCDVDARIVVVDMHE